MYPILIDSHYCVSGIYRSAINHAQVNFHVTMKCNPTASHCSLVLINIYLMPGTS